MLIPNEAADKAYVWRDLVRFDPFTGSKVMHWSGIPSKISGTYILKDPSTGEYYIGSSGGISYRISEHRSSLLKGDHFSSRLQRCFNKKKHLVYAVIPTPSKEEALDLEQTLLDLNKDDPLLINEAMDARRPGLGRKPSEENLRKLKESQNTDSWKTKNHAYTKSKLHSERVARMFSKPISIHGVVYPSCSEASRVLGVHENTIRHRLKNSDSLYKDWFFINKA